MMKIAVFAERLGCGVQLHAMIMLHLMFLQTHQTEAQCGIGMYELAPSVCEACPPGRFSDELGAHSCIDCDVGTYASPEFETGIHYRRYDDIPDRTMDVLLGHSNFLDGHDFHAVLDTYETPITTCDNCGKEMEGYFRPRMSGAHIFKFFSNDEGRLWFGASKDEAMAAPPIAHVTTSDTSFGWTPPRAWDLYPDQTSNPQQLTAGNYYYIHSLSNEAAGGDYNGVGVIEPDGNFLAPVPVTAVGPANDSWTYLHIKTGAGASSCSSCNVGQYDHDSDPATQCSDCPAGQYNSDEGAADTCQGSCPAGTYSLPGSQSASGCVWCDPGQYDDDNDPSTLCVVCPADTYSHTAGALHCESCQAGLGALAGSTSCDFCSSTGICQSGYFCGSTEDTVATNLSPRGDPLKQCFACNHGTCGCTDMFASNWRNVEFEDGSCAYDTLCADGWVCHRGTAEDKQILPRLELQEGERHVVRYAISINNSATRSENTNGDGGGLIAKGCEVTLSHVDFINCTSDDNAGTALFTNGASASLSFTDVTNSATSKFGGALYLSGHATANMQFVSITYSVSGQWGGGVYVSSATLYLSHAMVEHNQAFSGGGVCISPDSTATIMHTRFAHNKAETRGGALLLYSCSAHVQFSTFYDNSAQTDGGAIAVDNSVLSISRSTLHQNSAAHNGGGIHIKQGSAIVSGVTLESNTAASEATGEGDHIFASRLNSIKISDTTMEPYVNVGGMAVAISGVLAGCEAHPCALGEACSYSRYSLSCQACPENTVGLDGIECTSCPPSMGPNDNRTACEKCTGNTASSLGVCKPCPNGLVADSSNIGCDECGVHQTTIDSLTLDSRATCGCEDKYYNSSDETELFVCFVNGYDRDVIDDAKARRDAVQRTGQSCQECPLDAAGEECVVCSNGARPTVAAGYTVPQLGDRSSARRAMQDDDTSNVVLVYRCHIDVDTAIKRCPLNPELPGQCSPGYSGYLCDSCAEGYGMNEARECAPCESTTSFFFLLGIGVGSLLICVTIVAKLWGVTPLKHFPRCAFQPGRILITYSQVTTQLGDVLDFTYPGVFGDLLRALRPILDAWGLLFRALGPSECFGISGFSAKWFLRVIGLPGILGALVFLMWVVDRYRFGSIKAHMNMKGKCFFAVFFCYPTICMVCFASFICKKLGETADGEPITVLVSDDSVMCDDPNHRALQAASAVIIAIVAIGLPLGIGFMLVRASRQYERDAAATYSKVAERIAKELDVEESQAAWVVRDIAIGNDYSFLMDAYRPEYLYWEAMDMLRKLALIGLVLVIGRGSIAQLAVAIILSFGFFALQMKTWPHKLEQDNFLRAATETHVFIVITAALILKQDLTWESVGVDVYDTVLLVTFIVLVPGAAVVAVASKVRHVSRLLQRERDTDTALQRRQRAFDLQVLGLADIEDREILKRCVEGWYVRKRYGAFLSHFKNEAAAEARVLKLELTRALRTSDEQIFLDSDNLTDLRNLLENVEQSDVILLLYTKGVFARPWCLLELITAVKANVPILIVKINNVFAGDTEMIGTILDDLPAYLEKNNPRCDETLRSFDIDANEVAEKIKPALMEAETVTFDPHQSSAIMKAQITQMAQAMVDVASPENAPIISELLVQSTVEEWSVRRTYAVYIILDEANDLVIGVADELKSWLLRNTSLEARHILIETSGRATHEVEVSDMSPVAKDVDCVMLIQTSKVLHLPRCLARLYWAAKHQVPIVPVVLMSNDAQDRELMYNFETAKPMLASLGKHLDESAIAALETATGSSIESIGMALSLLLPNIISKPYNLRATVNETDAQMTEIKRTLHAVSATTQPDIDASMNQAPKPHEDSEILVPKMTGTLDERP